MNIPILKDQTIQDLYAFAIIRYNNDSSIRYRSQNQVEMTIGLEDFMEDYCLDVEGVMVTIVVCKVHYLDQVGIDEDAHFSPRVTPSHYEAHQLYFHLCDIVRYKEKMLSLNTFKDV